MAQRLSERFAAGSIVVAMVPVVMTPAVMVVAVIKAPPVGIAAMGPAVPMMVAVVIAVRITQRDIAEIKSDADGGMRRGANRQGCARDGNQGGGNLIFMFIVPWFSFHGFRMKPVTDSVCRPGVEREAPGNCSNMSCRKLYCPYRPVMLPIAVCRVASSHRGSHRA
jgi:hypothetical protein